MVQRSKNSISTKPRFSYWFFFYKSLFGNLYSVIELIFQKWIWIMLLCTFKDVQRTIMTILDSLYFLPSSNHKVFFEKPWTLENGYYMATVYLIPSLNTMVVVFKISNGLKSFINHFFSHQFTFNILLPYCLICGLIRTYCTHGKKVPSILFYIHLDSMNLKYIFL